MYEIKQLDWVKKQILNVDEFYADSAGGLFRIGVGTQSVSLSHTRADGKDCFYNQSYPTIKEAKEAAQNHYEAEVKKHLEDRSGRK